MEDALPVCRPRPEDKENADPRQNGLQNQPLKLEKVEQEKKTATSFSSEVEMQDEEVSQDGFDVNDDLQLDNEDMDDQPPRLKIDLEAAKVAEEEDKSPLIIISSLLKSRVLIESSASEAVLEAENNGASPMFTDQQQPLERRRLDFGTNAPPASSPPPKRLFRRCVSMVERPQNTSPISRPFKASFKRPNVPQVVCENQQIFFGGGCHQQPLSKRLKRGCLATLATENNVGVLTKSASTSELGGGCSSPMLKLSLSESEANIKKACLLADVPDLTGDRSRKLALPTCPGTGRSGKTLDNINCHTLADLIRGRYAEAVDTFRIVDARYSYEFNGGHIGGAENFGAWDEEQFFKEFLPDNIGVAPAKKKNENDDCGTGEKRNILIFHCEFSSARGPALMASLRSRDRKMNKETYPALHYPECYLLCEGYKKFYSHYPELCDPRDYVPMAHPNYASEERKFHKKSRSWAPGGTISRTGTSSRLLKL